MDRFDSPQLLQHPIHSSRPIRVIIIGAGPSGLLMAYKLNRNFENLEITVYEKNPDVGGTWYENTYPGCTCDTPAHGYVWSFEPNPLWSATYAPAHEIHKYFKQFCDKYDLQRCTNLCSRVIGAEWEGGDGIWRVSIVDEISGERSTDTCQVLINAGGILNRQKWPEVPFLHSRYAGQLVHSAAWPKSVTFEGKSVAVVGNGPSAIQIIPAILPTVSRLTAIMREPAWVGAAGSSSPRPYSDAEKQAFSQHPGALLQLRKWLAYQENKDFSLFVLQSETQESTRLRLTDSMLRVLQGHTLQETLIPSYPVGCRRLTPGVGYMEALIHPNTDTIVEKINEATKTGLIIGGKEHNFDAIICATGFYTSFKPCFPIIGRGGRDLRKEWDSEPRGYFGMAAAGFPNYFTLLGPNSPVGNGPLLIAIEAQADYICKIITRIQTQNIKSMSVKEEAVNDFVAYTHAFMKTTVWSEPCHSWYKGSSTASGDKKISALWPGSTLHYKEAIESVRYEDYDIEFLPGGRFSYLGNGRSRVESHPAADISFYIRNTDDSPLYGSKFVYEKLPSYLL